MLSLRRTRSQQGATSPHFSFRSASSQACSWIQRTAAVMGFHPPPSPHPWGRRVHKLSHSDTHTHSLSLFKYAHSRSSLIPLPFSFKHTHQLLPHAHFQDFTSSDSGMTQEGRCAWKMDNLMVLLMHWPALSQYHKVLRESRQRRFPSFFSPLCSLSNPLSKSPRPSAS